MNTAGTTYAKGAIVGVSRKDALGELQRRQRAGLIHSAGQLALITHGGRAGQYAIPVYLITSPRPARRKIPRWVPVVLAATLLPGTFLALVGWVLASLSAASLALTLGAVLAAFLGWLKVAHGRRSVQVTTTTTVSFR